MALRRGHLGILDGVIVGTIQTILSFVTAVAIIFAFYAHATDNGKGKSSIRPWR